MLQKHTRMSSKVRLLRFQVCMRYIVYIYYVWLSARGQNERKWANTKGNNVPIVLPHFTRCGTCTIAKTHNEISFHEKNSNWCRENEKHKNESTKITIQIHCAHKAFKWKFPEIQNACLFPLALRIRYEISTYCQYIHERWHLIELIYIEKPWYSGGGTKQALWNSIKYFSPLQYHFISFHDSFDG